MPESTPPKRPIGVRLKAQMKASAIALPRVRGGRARLELAQGAELQIRRSRCLTQIVGETRFPAAGLLDHRPRYPLVERGDDELLGLGVGPPDGEVRDKQRRP